MTVIINVEDGTKPANANSYISLTDADAYHASMGNTDWATNKPDARSQALILATQSVDLLYGAKYESYIYFNSNQALLYPRAQFWDANYRLITDSTIPNSLKNAVCEIAQMQLNSIEIFPVQASSSTIKSESVKLGSLAVSDNYSKTVEGESFDGFRKIDLIIRPLLKTAYANWGLKA